MSKKHQIYLHQYLKKLSSQQKKDLSVKIKKRLGKKGRPDYIYQCGSGTNTPEIGSLVCDAIIAYSLEHRVNRCYLTEESIAAGYESINKKKPLKQ